MSSVTIGSAAFHSASVKSRVGSLASRGFDIFNIRRLDGKRLPKEHAIQHHNCRQPTLNMIYESAELAQSESLDYNRSTELFYEELHGRLVVVGCHALLRETSKVWQQATVWRVAACMAWPRELSITHLVLGFLARNKS